MSAAVGGISVIIPAYNEAPVIGRTLEQFEPWRTRYGLELVVADDDSTDGTAEVAGRLADRVVASAGRRRGIAANRNRGAAAATRPLLVFIDADIRLGDLPRFLDRVGEEFAAADLAAALTTWQVYPEEERFIDRAAHDIENALQRFWFLLGFPNGGGWCQIVRRSAFEAVGGYREELQVLNDYDLVFRLAKVGRIALLSDLCVYESPRRYRAEGYVWHNVRAFANALGVRFIGRPLFHRYRFVR